MEEPTKNPEEEKAAIERLRSLAGWVQKPPANQPGIEGPPCIWDNAPTRRAGSCFVCIMCGSSTSC